MTVINERNIFQKVSKEEVKQKLIKIFGENSVTDKTVDRYPYSYDMTECAPKMPDFIVIPENSGQLIELVKYCNSNLIPIVPYITGNNVGGLTIPEQGGIIVDFGKKMNKILHVNDEMMYAILEPGVTFGQLKKYLDDNYPHLRYSYPYAPPYAGVVGNVLLSGMNNMSNKIGSMGDSVNGLEVITAEGELVRIGSCFYGKDDADQDSWWSRYPMPDLMGLFINWQGMTGLVTKCAVQLWPKNPYEAAYVAIAHEASDLVNILREVGRTETVEDMSVFSAQAIKLVVNIEHPKRLPEEPGYSVVMSMSAKTEDLMKAKIKLMKETIEKLKKDGNRIILLDFNEFAKIFNLRVRCAYDLPSVILPTVLKSGLTWFGSYAPTHRLEKLYEGVADIFEKHNFESPILYGKIMKASHYGIFRPILPYNKFKDEEETHQIMEEIADLAIGEGCIPYKTPTWLTAKMRKKINPGWIKLFEKIKLCMDPNNIFNPGRWNIE
ncbi:MAG: FAD-binding oxidoreductase [Promethearchaeota archaeon]